MSLYTKNNIIVFARSETTKQSPKLWDCHDSPQIADNLAMTNQRIDP
ncbi:MAG: hypothetical protein HOC18_08790 [Candidatus Marinimicrobia bacterium]|nr:hypothetical protein [Candidatus Neomarinimicrobiota bacterium]